MLQTLFSIYSRFAHFFQTFNGTVFSSHPKIFAESVQFLNKHATFHQNAVESFKSQHKMLFRWSDKPPRTHSKLRVWWLHDLFVLSGWIRSWATSTGWCQGGRGSKAHGGFGQRRDLWIFRETPPRESSTGQWLWNSNSHKPARQGFQRASFVQNLGSLQLSPFLLSVFHKKDPFGFQVELALRLTSPYTKKLSLGFIENAIFSKSHFVRMSLQSYNSVTVRWDTHLTQNLTSLFSSCNIIFSSFLLILFYYSYCLESYNQTFRYLWTHAVN